MNQGARDANAESARRGAQNTQDEILQQLRGIHHLLHRILEETVKPQEHLWPRQ